MRPRLAASACLVIAAALAAERAGQVVLQHVLRGQVDRRWQLLVRQEVAVGQGVLEQPVLAARLADSGALGAVRLLDHPVMHVLFPGCPGRRLFGRPGMHVKTPCCGRTAVFGNVMTTVVVQTGTTGWPEEPNSVAEPASRQAAVRCSSFVMKSVSSSQFLNAFVAP